MPLQNKKKKNSLIKSVAVATVAFLPVLSVLLTVFLSFQAEKVQAEAVNKFPDIKAYAKVINIPSFFGKPVRIPILSDNPDKIPGGDQDFLYVYPPQLLLNTKAKTAVSYPIKSVYLASGGYISAEKEKTVKEGVESWINNCFCNQEQLLKDLKDIVINRSTEPKKISYFQFLQELFPIIKVKAADATTTATDTTATATDPNSVAQLETLMNSDDPQAKQMMMLLLLNLLLSQKLAEASNLDKTQCLAQSGEWISEKCYLPTDSSTTATTTADNVDKERACTNANGKWKNFTSSKNLCLAQCGRTDRKCTGSALTDFEDEYGIYLNESDPNLAGCQCATGLCADADGNCLTVDKGELDDDNDEILNKDDQCLKTADGETVNTIIGDANAGCSCSDLAKKGKIRQQVTCPSNACDGPYMVTYPSAGSDSCADGIVTPYNCVATRNTDQTCNDMYQQQQAQQQQQDAQKQQQQQDAQKAMQDLLKQLMGGDKGGGQGGGCGKGGDQGGGGGGGAPQGGGPSSGGPSSGGPTGAKPVAPPAAATAAPTLTPTTGGTDPTAPASSYPTSSNYNPNIDPTAPTSSYGNNGVGGSTNSSGVTQTSPSSSPASSTPNNFSQTEMAQQNVTAAQNRTADQAKIAKENELKSEQLSKDLQTTQQEIAKTQSEQQAAQQKLDAAKEADSNPLVKQIDSEGGASSPKPDQDLTKDANVTPDKLADTPPSDEGLVIGDKTEGSGTAPRVSDSERQVISDQYTQQNLQSNVDQARQELTDVSQRPDATPDQIAESQQKLDQAVAEQSKFVSAADQADYANLANDGSTPGGGDYWNNPEVQSPGSVGGLSGAQSGEMVGGLGETSGGLSGAQLGGAAGDSGASVLGTETMGGQIGAPATDSFMNPGSYMDGFGSADNLANMAGDMSGFNVGDLSQFAKPGDYEGMLDAVKPDGPSEGSNSGSETP